MKNPLLKKLLPHAIAIILFLAVSALFCKPVLDGNVMNQHDNVGWKGMAQNAFEYKEKNGHFPLWNPNLFSGMPNYQVAEVCARDKKIDRQTQDAYAAESYRRWIECSRAAPIHQTDQWLERLDPHQGQTR